MKKRLLSLITALALCLTLLPAPLLAEELWNGDGSETLPYQIDTIDDLKQLAKNVNEGNTYEGKYFKLTKNLTHNSNVLNTDGTPNSGPFEQWTPIGLHYYPDNTKFSGIFDGQGYTISGLYFNNEDTDNVGLFGFSDGTIKNVGVIDSYFHGNYYVGGVCGQIIKSEGKSTGAIIEKCYNKSTVTSKMTESGEGAYIGGVCGVNWGGTVKNCYNIGKVEGRQEAGGVCGYNINGGELISCYNKGTVSGRIYIGGVCGGNRVLSGETESVIKDCYNLGAVSSNYMYSGGVCGYNGGDGESDRTCTITNCYNSGEVTCDLGFSGGVCGQNYSTIKNCYNTGAVTGSDTYGNVGGVCGRSYSGTISNCYNVGKVHDTASVYVGGVCGRDEKSATTFTNCYYRTDCATIGDNKTQNGIGSGPEGQATEDIEGSTTAKTAEEFASGEMIRLLQPANTDQIWGQSIGKETSPVLLSFLSPEEQEARQVYKVTFKNGDTEYDARYANPNGTVKLPTAPSDRDTLAFYRWSLTNNTDGEEFTASTKINDDMTVYSIWQEKYGQIEDEKTITTTYGTEKTQNLSAYMRYAGTTQAAGKFIYSITSENSSNYFTISDDILTVAANTPAGIHRLTIMAMEKTPQTSLFPANSISYGTSPVTLSVTVTVNRTTPSVSIGGDGEGGKTEPGSDGTVIITPEDGYEITHITVNGEEVEIPANGKLTGLKPTDTVVVTFGNIHVSQQFADVPAEAWYEEAVQYVVDHGLFYGTSENTFSPDETMTRGMVATVLYRLAGEPEITAENRFNDVEEGKYYTEAIAWADENDIVIGYGNDMFGPNDPITREQFATILWRYTGSPTATETLDSFTDGSKTDTWAVDALRWAVENEIINGKGNGILDPTGKATRAEAATILMRYCKTFVH